jgi:hypothetical protein
MDFQTSKKSQSPQRLKVREEIKKTEPRKTETIPTFQLFYSLVFLSSLCVLCGEMIFFDGIHRLIPVAGF